jgi:RNA polymerase sigma-70 factor (ECF subfamily)
MSVAVEHDDRALCRALRAGDEGAFEEIVERYHGRLRRFALTYVQSAAAADEVVQDTWLAVIRGIDRFEGRSSLKTWIFQILVNNAITRAQRDGRTVPFSAFDGYDDDEPSVDPSRFLDEHHERWPGHWAAPVSRWNELPEDALLGHETLAVLWDAIAALPEMQRRVITLRDIDGCSPGEVCELLDVSEANQRVLLHRARSKARAALETYFQGYAGTT